MIVERTYNEKEIRSIITHHDIWPRLADDKSGLPDDYRPDPGRIYIKGEDGEIFGLGVASRRGTVVYNVHFQVLPVYRKTHAIPFAEKFIQWMWDNTGARKLVAEVPDFHQNVIGFAHKVGFVVEGINTRSFLKDGKLHDQFYLGLEHE